MRRAEELISLALEEPARQEIADIGAWLAALDARSSAAPPPRWNYVIITPLGMPARAWLEDQLEERGIQIKTREPIVQWPEISTALQVKRRDARHLRRAALFEAAWRALFPDGTAEAWGIEPRWHLRLAGDKTLLRTRLRNLLVSFASERAVLHALHLANPCEASFEAHRLESALELIPGEP